MDIGAAHVGPGTSALLVLAGIGAGIVGSTAGLASLISYPALLAIGLPPVTANVTNTVALIGSSIGSVSSSRQELRGQRADIRRWIGIAAVGGAAGATLLLLGPPGTFEALVPYLVAGASTLLLLSPRLRAIRSRRPAQGEPLSAPCRDPRGNIAEEARGSRHGARKREGRPAGADRALRHVPVRGLLRGGGRSDDPCAAAVRHRQVAPRRQCGQEPAVGGGQCRGRGGVRAVSPTSTGPLRYHWGSAASSGVPSARPSCGGCRRT